MCSGGYYGTLVGVAAKLLLLVSLPTLANQLLNGWPVQAHAHAHAKQADTYLLLLKSAHKHYTQYRDSRVQCRALLPLAATSVAVGTAS